MSNRELLMRIYQEIFTVPEESFELRRGSSNGRSSYRESISANFKGALLGLRPFLAAESPLKMMKNAFCFTSKTLFVLKIFKFLS